MQRCEEGEGYERSLIRKRSTFIYNYVWFNLSSFEYDIKLNSSYTNQQLIEFARRREKFLASYEKDIGLLLYELRDRLIENNRIYNYHGQDCIRDTSWIIESSLLFSISLITTIGYGHVAVSVNMQ